MEKPICPNCGNHTEENAEIKSWKLKGGKGEVSFIVHLYECNSCNHRFRKLERV